MEHWVEVIVTLHRDIGDESTVSDACPWAEQLETIARLQAELLRDYPEPIGRLYPSWRVRYRSVAPRLVRYILRLSEEVTPSRS